MIHSDAYQPTVFRGVPSSDNNNKVDNDNKVNDNQDNDNEDNKNEQDLVRSGEDMAKI